MTHIDVIRKALVGKTIVRIDLAPERLSFVIQTTTGPVGFVVTADCCSTSWVDSIEGPDDLTGAEIIAVDMPDLESCGSDSWRPDFYGEVGVERCKNFPHSEYRSPDCIKAYQTLLRTTKGTVAIEYRNNSNGYYGGSLELMP